MTLVNGFLTFVLPLTNGDFRDPVYPAYVFFATIETVCTSVIIWQAWTWSAVEAAVSSERIVGNPETEIGLAANFRVVRDPSAISGKSTNLTALQGHFTLSA